MKQVSIAESAHRTMRQKQAQGPQRQAKKLKTSLRAGCRFLQGDPLFHAFAYCGGRRQAGSAFCAHHQSPLTHRAARKPIKISPKIPA